MDGWLNLEFGLKNLGGPIKLFTSRRQKHAIHMPLRKLIGKGFEFLCGLNLCGRGTIPMNVE